MPVDTSLHAQPAALARAAGDLLDLVRAGWDEAGPLLSSVDVRAAAFGALPHSRSLAGAHQSAVDAAARIVDHLVDVLAGDADRLLRVAFALVGADTAAAHRTGAAHHPVGR